MERGNPQWACADGPMSRSLRPLSRPQISEYGARGDAEARGRLLGRAGILASVSSPGICLACDLNTQIRWIWVLAEGRGHRSSKVGFRMEGKVVLGSELE